MTVLDLFTVTLYIDTLNNTDYYVLIASSEYSLYLDILDITKKYKFISDDELPTTDFEGDLFAFIFPYLKENNVDLDKVYKISKLTTKKQKKIFKYYEKVASIHNFN